MRIDRRHSDPILLDDPALTLIFSAQPDVLSGTVHTPSFKGRGLIGRFLYFLPRSIMGARKIDTAPVPAELKQTYSSTLRRIIDLPWRTDSKGLQAHHVFKLDYKAERAWLDFAEHIELALAEGASMAGMRDWGGKLPGQALRLAGLYHVTLYPDPQNHLIEASTMQAVVKLSHLLIAHAKAAFDLIGTDDTIECAKAILKWIVQERLESFTARACLEKIKGRWPKMALVNPGLNILEERGFIMAQEKKKAGRGRPSRDYLVNPLSFGVKI